MPKVTKSPKIHFLSGLPRSGSYRYPRLLKFVERHLTPYLTGVGENGANNVINRKFESREN